MVTEFITPIVGKAAQAASHPVIGWKRSKVTQHKTKSGKVITVTEESSVQIRAWEAALAAFTGTAIYLAVVGDLPFQGDDRGGGLGSIGEFFLGGGLAGLLV